jgi:purine-nucleoside phosphorylase
LTLETFQGGWVPTPHISAEPGEIAEAILLPGDPLRAEYIADTFLSDAKKVTAVRNMFGFTGTYEDLPVSVMGTGMGIPSASIYVSELIDHYDVQRLVRVGSCGGIGSDVAVRDVIIATGASTDSTVNRARYGGWDFAAIADFGLASTAVLAAGEAGVPVRVGNVHSADLFYNPNPAAFDVMERMGVLAVEMEAAGIYGVAAERRARALTILTVSDHVRTGESTSSDERERSFGDMVRIALEGLLLDTRAAG